MPSGSVSAARDRKSTRLNSSHSQISYAVFCLKKKKNIARLRAVTHCHQARDNPNNGRGSRRQPTESHSNRYLFFFLNDTAPTEIYTLSLHDALPISYDPSATPAPEAAASPRSAAAPDQTRSEEHTSELQSQSNLVCSLLLEKKKQPTHRCTALRPLKTSNAHPHNLLP